MSAAVEKVAFIHFGKAAGRYVNHYLCSHVFRNQGGDLAQQEYKEFNSWHPPFLLERDWTEAELMQLANNRFPHQYPTPGQVRAHHRLWKHNFLDKQYVHNHHYSWNRSNMREFRRNGWFTFMFIRDPADLLCSLWTWARKVVATGADPWSVLRPTRLIGLPLDAFIREIVGADGLSDLYALPAYVDDIAYVAEFTEENFQRLLLERFDHSYRPASVARQYRQSSGNPGYAVYRRSGEISDRTHALINRNVAVRGVRERLGAAANAMVR